MKKGAKKEYMKNGIRRRDSTAFHAAECIKLKVSSNIEESDGALAIITLILTKIYLTHLLNFEL